MLRVRPLSVLLAALALAPTASADVLWVGPPGCAGASPCYSSIQAAVDAATSGDNVRVQPGTYVEQVDVADKNPFSGATEADRITIEADPAAPVGSVVVDGSVAQCTNGFAVRITRSNRITLRGLVITGAGGQAIALPGGNNANQSVRIERNRIFGNGSTSCNGGITIARDNPDTLVANNLIYGNGRNGITFIDADGGPHTLVGNTIHANGWSGVHVARSHQMLLANNLITGNGTQTGSTGGRFGIGREDSTSPDPAEIRLLSNLVCGNRLGEIAGPALDGTDAGNRTPTGAEGAGVSASAGCEVLQAVYADLSAGTGSALLDFGLAEHSPAVDTGVDPRTLGLDPSFDASFVADFSAPAVRPIDGDGDAVAEFDAGALELGSGGPPPGDPPTVAITSPAEGALFSAQPIMVTVTATGADSVTVNGVGATQSGTSWSASVPLEEGDNTLTATATNAFGAGSASVGVRLDSPPVVVITSPANGTLTSAAEIQVTGTVTDAGPIASLSVNGVPAVVVGADWSALVPLALGTNTLTATAVDGVGHSGSASVEVTRGELPSITISSPADGALLATTPVLVTGSVTGLPEPDVSVNGIAALVSGGTFSVEVPLAEGPNTLTATATNALGSASASVQVTLDTTPPLVQITSPPNGAIFPVFSVPVSGSVTDASGIASLSVNGQVLPPGTTFSTFLTLPEGMSAIVVQAVDAAGNTGAASVAVVVAVNDPPELAPVGDRTVSLGMTLQIQLAATDPDADALAFSASPLPLPANATLNAATGLFRFTPGDSQVGSLALTFRASDGILADTESVSITVEAPAAGDPTGIQGRVLDANDASNEITTPVVGATIRDLLSGVATLSDASGNFTLVGLGVGARTIEINGTTATGAFPYGSYRATFEFSQNVVIAVERPFFLPRIDPDGIVVVDPNVTTVVTNPNLGVTLTIPPHTVKDESGADFAGEISISAVPPGFTPGALPDTMEPSLVITIQPMGLTFAQPAPITFPNVDELQPDDDVEIWSLSHDTGEFFKAGFGRVSGDGARVETISGGVQESSWHFFLCELAKLLKALQAGGDVGNDERCTRCEGVGSDLIVPTGAISTRLALPSYVSQGESRALELVYRSDRAHPHPVLPFDPTILAPAARPARISHELTVGGVAQGTRTFVDTTPLSHTIDETLRIAASFDASALPTGRYPVTLRTTSHYRQSPLGPGQRVSGLTEDFALVINDQASPFGAGWGIAGLQRLHVLPDASALVVDGGGDYARFTPMLQASGIVTTGDVIDVAPLQSVVAGNLRSECRSRIQLFTEQTALLLPADVTVDVSAPGTVTNPAGLTPLVLPAGTLVASHLIHVDPRFTEGASRTGSATFDREIVGLIVTAGSLNATDTDLGSPETTYAANSQRGLDLGSQDRVTLSPDRRTVSVEVTLPAGSNVVDEVRVLTVGDPQASPDDVLLLDRFDCENRGLGVSDYAAFQYWDVLESVDLFGVGFFGTADSRVDLDGNEITGPAGRLSSKETFLLEPGVYVLAFEWFPGTELPNSMVVSLGSAYQETFTATAAGPGTPVVRRITVTATESAKLVFDHTITPADQNGIRIDDVVLRRGFTFASPDGELSALRQGGASPFVRTLPDGTELRFDMQGALTARIDRNGNTTSFGYDSAGRLMSVTDPVGRETTLAYAGGRLSRVTDPAGRDTFFQHDGAGNLTRAELPDGSEREYGYDPRHLMTEETSARGFTTGRVFDFAGRLVSVALPDAAGTVRTTANGQAAGLVDLASGVGTASNPAPVVRPAEATSELVDGEGRALVMETGALGASTAIVDAAGLRTEIDRDADSNPTESRFPSGHVVSRTFDDRGNLRSLTDAVLGGTSEFGYHPIWNRLAEVTDARGKTTRLGYDDADGDLLSVESPLGRTTSFLYDTANPDGLVDRVIDVFGTTTRFDYSPGTRHLAAIRQGSGSDERVTSFSYTPEGYVATITDAVGRSSAFDYDGAGRMVRRTFPDSRFVDFDYDEAGNLVSLTPPSRPAHVFVYDARERASSYVPPAAFPSDPRTVFTYNGEDQLRRVDRPDGRSAVLEYDGAGRLAEIEIARGRYAFGYDGGTGLLSVIEAPDGDVLGFGYAARCPSRRRGAGRCRGT